MSAPPRPPALILHPEASIGAVDTAALDARLLLAAIVEGSDDAILAKNLDGIILSWNSGAERLYGYTAEEAVGRHVSMLLPPEMREDVDRLVEQLRERTGVQQYETVRMHRDGRRLHVSLTISPILNERAEVIGASTIARDIGPLKAEQRRLKLLSDLGSALAAELDEEQVLRELAARLVPELADYCVTYLAYGREVRRVGAAHADPAAEPIIRRLASMPPPGFDDPSGAGAVVRTGEPIIAEAVSPALLRSVASGEYLEVLEQLGPVSSIVLPLRARHRTVGAVSLSATSRSNRHYGRDELGLAQELADRAALALDNARLYGEAQAQIRQRRAAEEQLRSRFEQLRTLYQMTEAAARATTLEEIYQQALNGLERTLGVDRASILLFDEDGVLRFKAWHGLSDGYRAAVEGHSPWTPDAVDPAPITMEDVSAEEGLEDGLRATILREGINAVGFIPLTFGTRLLGKFMLYFDRPHSFRPEEVEVARTIAGTIASTIIRMQNEASLLRAKSEAERANRAKLNFLGMISHELRTPLNAIGGYVELLQLGVHGPVSGDQQQSLARIAANQRHLLGLINDILSFARLEAGQVDYDLQDVPLARVVGALEAVIAPLATARGVSFTTEMSDGSLLVRADEERLRQILINLVTNAIKFTPEAGAVRLECSRVADGVNMRVVDTGCGIDAEHLETIFDPFTQVDRGGRGEQAGAGLGLAISREFARGMGGDIEVASFPGRGSIFTVRLPSTDGADEPSELV